MTTTTSRRRRPTIDPTAINLAEVAKLSVEDLTRLSVEEPAYFAAIEAANTRFLLADAKVNQLLYYRPLNADCWRVHESTAFEIGLQGGNKSGKTGVSLAELAIQMTGVVPLCFRVCRTCGQPMVERAGTWLHEAPDAGHDGVLRYPVVKLRAPIRARLTVTSLVSAYDVNLKPKLQWWMWNGKLRDRLRGDPELGHWGFIPQGFLLHGDWMQSWSEKHRLLTLANESTMQVMSHGQADGQQSDFDQGAFHLIVEDEIPPEHVHRSNRLRAMELGGRILTGGTPPDDRTAAVTVAWFFDQVLAPGLEAVNPEETFAVALWTENNTTLEAVDIDRAAKGLTGEQREARLHGGSIHLHGLVLPGFTEKPKTWCFGCGTPVQVIADACTACGGSDLARYCHVWDDADVDWPGPTRWPLVFYMDPHQSRPTACAWFKVDPNDGWWQVAEREIAGDAAAVVAEVEACEKALEQRAVWRKGDPKITVQTNQYAKDFQGQPFNIKRAFAEVGFFFEDANTNFTVARERLLEALKPLPYTRAPRLRVHRSCTRTIYQVGHFVWNTRGRRENTNVKEEPSRNHSDFPALWRYLAMDAPSYRQLEWARDPQPLHAAASGAGRNRSTGW